MVPRRLWARAKFGLSDSAMSTSDFARSRSFSNIAAHAATQSRKRFVRVLLDRLFRVFLGELQRVVGIVAPAVLVVEMYAKPRPA